MAAAVGNHGPGGSLCAEHHAFDVDVEVQIVVFHGGVEQPGRLDHAGHVQQHVRAAPERLDPGQP